MFGLLLMDTSLSFFLRISTKVKQLCVYFMSKEKSGKISLFIFKFRYIHYAMILLQKKSNKASKLCRNKLIRTTSLSIM